MRLAINGFDVFPIAEGKKNPPLVKFTVAASSDPEAVASEWRKCPEANIGVRTNGGTLALDVDTQEAARFVSDLELPSTTTVRTPSGGRHYYLTGRSPTRTAIRPGLDVRGHRGYVVAPGSKIGERAYEWELPPWECLPQEAPPQVLELVQERTKRQALDGSPIPEGRRNNTLVRIAGTSSTRKYAGNRWP